MQINFEATKLKEARAYVNKLKPKKLSRGEKPLDGEFYATQKHPSLIKRVLHFLFK